MRFRWQIVTVVLMFIFMPLFTPSKALCGVHEVYTTPLTFEKIDELLTQGDNQQAWEMLENPPYDSPNTANRLWRMARTQYEMGRLAEKNAPEYFKEAAKYARAAITIDPDSSDGYKWLAIALGAQAKYSDTKEQVHQSREIKESIEKSIALNPDDDISYLVLSRWHYKVSGLGTIARAFANIIYGGVPKASLAEAEKLLWQAIGLHDRISHRYNLERFIAVWNVPRMGRFNYRRRCYFL